jgi:hypothetical protein
MFGRAAVEQDRAFKALDNELARRRAIGQIKAKMKFPGRLRVMQLPNGRGAFIAWGKWFEFENADVARRAAHELTPRGHKARLAQRGGRR